MKNKKILVTGAAGFVGANLVRKLLEIGSQVYIFTRTNSDRWRIKSILKDVKEYRVDLLNYEELQKSILEIKPQIILHTAAHGGYFFQQDQGNIMQTNIMGTVNLIKVCSDVGFECFVNTGSSSEYGIKSNPMKEDDMPEPYSVYAVSKAAGTLFSQMKSKYENLPIVTLRLFSVYGYYEEKTRLIPDVVFSCLKGKNPRVSTSTPVRDFIFIEDVVEAYLKAVSLIGNAKGEILNIGYGKQYSLGEVVDSIIRITGNKVKAEWGKVINLRKEPSCWVADTAKTKMVLGWEPRYDLEKGLKKTIDWFKENSKLYI